MPLRLKTEFYKNHKREVVESEHDLDITITRADLETQIWPTIARVNIQNEEGKICRFFLSVHLGNNGRPKASLSTNMKTGDKVTVRKELTGSFWIGG